ncbi:MAG: LysE family transporter [Candidatus Bathyarchaeia archaeon]
MEVLHNLYLFLASVVFISLSGVVMPGPVFAATVARGYADRNAGALVALGHGAVEFPLMVLIYLGLAQFFASSLVKAAVGLVGGGMLVFMGVKMLRFKGELPLGGLQVRYGSLTVGAATTGANPYFFLWWATVGAALIMSSAAFGLIGFLLFAIIHWLCDFSWYLFLSVIVFKSKRLWSRRTCRMIFGFCALLLIGFGVWFIFSAL